MKTIGRKKKWTEPQLIEAVKNSRSLAEVMKRLKLYPRGSNYDTIKRYIVMLRLDTGHFDGKPWTTGLRLVDTGSLRNMYRIKERLIVDRGHKCEKCNNTHWLKRAITLELHHIDGNRTNNRDSNLMLLCPNCHSQTETWRRQK